MKTAYFWLTPQGEQLALRLQKAFGGTVEPKAAFDTAVQRDFVSCDLLVFIMASGIAVRKIAPLVQSKASDPAVLVLDQQGKYVISLLSGHLGGANAAARRFAAYLGGEAVITTATDVEGVPAFDLFAKQNDLVIENLHELKHISSALVAEEKITLLTDLPVEPDAFSENIVPETHPVQPCAVVISDQLRDCRAEHTLYLRPKSLVLGVGCKKQIPILALCEKYRIPLEIVLDDAILGCNYPFAASPFVQQVTGLPSVSEASAYLASGCGEVLTGKVKYSGVTFAACRKKLPALRWKGETS